MRVDDEVAFERCVVVGGREGRDGGSDERREGWREGGEEMRGGRRGDERREEMRGGRRGDERR